MANILRFPTEHRTINRPALDHSIAQNLVIAFLPAPGAISLDAQSFRKYAPTESAPPNLLVGVLSATAPFFSKLEETYQPKWSSIFFDPVQNMFALTAPNAPASSYGNTGRRRFGVRQMTHL